MKGITSLHMEQTSVCHFRVVPTVIGRPLANHHQQQEADNPRPLPTSESTGGQFLTNSSNCGQLGSEYNELDFAGQFSSYSIESPVELLHDVWDGVWKKVTHRS